MPDSAVFYIKKIERKAMIKTNTIQSHIPASKTKGKTHTQTDKRSRQTRTANRMKAHSQIGCHPAILNEIAVINFTCLIF